MSKKVELNDEVIELHQNTLREFINGMALSDYERLLILKNLTSEQENKLAVKAQGAALYAALANMGRK